MAKLTKDHQDKINTLLKSKGFSKLLNEILSESGLNDLEIKRINIGPKDPPLELRDAFVKICPHGYPMIERCTRGGGCKWVCNHPNA